MAKPIGAFILPVIALAATAILAAIAPKATTRVEPDTTPDAYTKIVAAIAALLFYATISVVAVAAGFKLNVPAYVAGGAGLLLAILGNILGKTRRNSLIGVRTPWTLTSDEVWSRTNRLVGRLLVVGGVATIIGALAGWGMVILLCAVAATAMIATLHSYVTAKHLRGDT